MRDLTDKAYLVLGATSTLGKQTTLDLLKQGATVIGTGRNKDKLVQIKEETEKGNFLPVLMDVLDIETQNGLYDVIKQYGPLSGVIQSIGVSNMVPLKFERYEQMEDTFRINYFVPVSIINTLIRKKSFVPGASIVMIASIAGCGFSNIGLSSYAASKSALIGYVTSAALELAPKIRINAISPSMIETKQGMANDVMDLMDENKKENDLAQYPMKRYGTPEEVSQLIQFLLSEEASFITGQNYIMDGGRTRR